MEANFFDQFYAKSDGVTTLQMHTQHVLTAGENLLNNLAFNKEEKEFWKVKLIRCAVLHDLGKVHSEFQKRLRGEKCLPVRHEIISLWFCENFLNLPQDELFAIATHHKGIEPHLDKPGRLNRDVLTSDMSFHYKNAAQLLTKETLQKWLTLMKIDLELNTKELQTEISKNCRKLLLYSQQDKALSNSLDRKQLSLMRALLIAADHIGSAKMEQKIPAYKEIILKDFQPKKDGIYFENFKRIFKLLHPMLFFMHLQVLEKLKQH